MDGKNNKTCNCGADGSRKCAKPELSLFRQFVAMFLGGFIGSLLGTVLFKILVQLL